MKMNSTDKINKEYFPIQQFNKSIYIPIFSYSTI